MADQQAPHETSVPSQKRPLEEPSSPTGPVDGPDAKRPALDKITNDVTQDDVIAEAETTTGVTTDNDAVTEATNGDEPAQAIPNVTEASTGAGAAEQGDQVAQDAEDADADAATTAILTTKPVQSSGGADNTAASPSAPRQNYHDQSQWLHMRAIISTTEAATIIGKGGENVSEIRKQAGAKCTVSDYNRGAIERILTVSGLVDAVAKAFGLIIRTLNQEPLLEKSTPQSRSYPLRLLIPQILIGSIIGKAGSRIREIQEHSGARLNASEGTLAFSTERSLVVLGVADAIHIATYYVGTTLVDQLNERYGGPAASAYALRQGNGPPSAVPGGMNVVPFVPRNMGGMTSTPHMYRGMNNNRMPPAPQHAPPHASPYPQHAQPQMPQPQGPAGYVPPAGGPRGPYIGAQAPPQPYGQQGPVQPGPVAPQQYGQPGPGAGQSLTQQIYIPNDMVGAIIGKGGQKINEIRNLSNSVIKINEPNQDSQERLVTVTGTQEANQMALYMLYARLGESSKNSNATMPR